MPNLSCSQCGNKQKSIFCSLSDSESDDLCQYKKSISFKKGDTLFKEEQRPNGVYCINEGKIKLTRLNNNGRPTITRIVGRGDMLGHQSLFGEKNFKETAMAIENVTVCYIDRDYILQLMKNKPDVAMDVIAHLGKEMGAIEEKLSYFFTKNVRERVAFVLLDFSKKYGMTQDDGRVLLDIKLSREEMASLVGVATETLIRFISEFKEDHTIEQEGKRIFIKNYSQLESYAGV